MSQVHNWYMQKKTFCRRCRQVDICCYYPDNIYYKEVKRVYTFFTLCRQWLSFHNFIRATLNGSFNSRVNKHSGFTPVIFMSLPKLWKGVGQTLSQVKVGLTVRVILRKTRQITEALKKMPLNSSVFCSMIGQKSIKIKSTNHKAGRALECESHLSSRLC